MPVFDFAGPDGKIHSIEGPDGATPEQAFQMLQQHIGGASPTVGMGEDAAKSVASGLGTATIGTLGSVGDIRSLLSQGVDAAGAKLGFDPSTLKSAAGTVFRGLNDAPTSADIRSTVTDPLVDPDYKPQYLAGSLLKKGAEFGPNMLLGGPEGAAARLLTNVAAPAVGSEIGEGVAGPLGGIAGALAGGVGATSAAQKFKAMAAARQGASALPSGEKLVETGGNQFTQARDMNVVVTPDFATKTASAMRTALKDFDSEDAALKDVFRKIDRLDNLGSSPSVAMNDVENVRKQLSKLRLSADAPTREAAKQAQEVLTKSQMSLTPAETLLGDAPAYTQTMKNAVGNYAAGKRSNTIMGKVDLADLNAGTAGSGANQDNALRQALKQLARPVNNTNMPVAKKLGFNDVETAAIRQAATGTAVGNTARYLGKYAPTGIVSAAGGAGLGHLVGGPVGAAIPAVGYIAKKIGDLSTKRAVAAIDSLVRSRSPLAAQVAGQLPPNIISQMPAKSQRILQAMSVQQPPSLAPQPSIRPAPPQAVAPQRSMPIPQQAAPVFAPRAPVAPAVPSAPSITAAADGQPSRPSRVGLGENIRLGKYQDWTDGRIVKVGFVDGLKVEGTVPAEYKGDAAGFVLTKGENVYRVTPHRGMEKLLGADAREALQNARQNKSH